ncbi:MAG: hypothetical protein JXR91_05155 [Deltaproteobacteria bacterium]|nr:hypothetical protein [Deltaproteobacteria bacterium]
MFNRLKLLTAVLFIGMLSSLSAAYAENSASVKQVENTNSENSKLSAKDLFDKASTLFAEEKFEESAAVFIAAYNLKPSWKLKFNIGQAQAAAKQYGLALIAFEEYLSAGGDKIDSERQEYVLNEISRLKNLVGSIDIKAPKGSTVLIDDKKRGTTPLAGVLKISAGTNHIVKIILNDNILVERTVRLSGGDTISIEAEDETPKEVIIIPAALPADETNEQAEENKEPEKAVSEKTDITDENKEAEQAKEDIKTKPVATDSTKEITGSEKNRTETSEPLLNNTASNGSGLKAGGIALLLTGTGVAVTGGVLGVMAFSRSKNLSDDCPDKTCYTTDSVQNLKDSTKYGLISTIMIPAGATLFTTGLIMLIVNKKRGEKLNTGLNISPVVDASFNGVVLQGRF